MTHAMRSCLLLSAHGHAPYILGVKLARSFPAEICVPHYYGQIQLEILRSEFPDLADRIFTSETLGSLLKPLLRDKDFSPGFATYADNIHKNIAAFSKELEARLQAGIAAVSLSGVKKVFTHFDLALNTGLPVFSPAQPVFYVFVGKMSAIYELSPYQDANVKTLAGIWRDVESSFAGMFAPRLNSLYQQEYDTSGVTFTPPLASPYPLDDTPLPGNTTLVVTSGTRMDVENLCQLAEAAPNPHTLRESPDRVPFPRVSSSAWGNPRVTAILARSGLGTIWQAMVNKKPIGVLPGYADIDPEIYYNAKLVKNSGIGVILEKDISELTENLPVYKNKIAGHLEFEKELFGTNDGFDYIARKILAHHQVAAAK